MNNIELTKQSEMRDDASAKEVEDLVTFLRQNPCQLLKTGFRPLEIKYYFCSCDPEMKEPICEDCKDRCHKDHVTIKTEEIEAICTCGMKCHSIKNDSETVNKNYISKCYFHEFAKISGMNSYYEHQEEERPVCIFCYNFCDDASLENNYMMTPRNKAYIKRTVQTVKELPECGCLHKNHKELKFIYGKIKQLSTEIFNDLDFENLTQTHILNLILLSPKTFENIFRSFTEGIEIIESSIKDPQYQFEDFIAPNCEFNLALECLSKLSTKSKRLEYYCPRIFSILPSDKVICQIIERKFDHKLISIWNMKYHLITLFINFSFRKDFRSLPNFKICGIENLTPLQRLIRVKGVQQMENSHLSIIDPILTILIKLNHIKDCQPETYLVFYRCYQILKFFAKFCLLTNEQFHKFCTINDELITHFAEATKSVAHDRKRKHQMIDYQLQILNPMIKSLRYIIFHYNDQYIESLLKKEVDTNDVNFYHSAAELCKHTTKNVINVLTHIRFFKKKELDVDKDKILHKILTQATKIIAININHPDHYSTGLERLFDKNNEITLKYINNNFDVKEKELLDFCNNSLNEIENLYQKYYEFRSDLSEVVYYIRNSINSLFDLMELRGFSSKFLKNEKIDIDLNSFDIMDKNDQFVKLNSPDKRKIYPRRKTNVGLIVKESNNVKEDYKEKYKILLNKSLYIYSVLKIIKVCQKEYICRVKSEDSFLLEQTLFDGIMKLLSFMLEDNTDNGIVFLCTDFVEKFLLLNGTQMHKFTELLEYVIFQIMKSQYELSSSYTILQLITTTAKRSSNRVDSLATLEKVINIIKYTTKIIFIDSEQTNNKLRRIIKTIYNDNPLFTQFKTSLFSIDNNSHFESSSVMSAVDKEPILKAGTDESKKSQQPLNTLGELDENNIQILNNIMRKMFEIINYLYDGDATLKEMTFLESIIKPEEFPKILRNRHLELKFRTELLKFYRMVYIDLQINSEKIDLYRNLILNPPKPSNEEEGIEVKEIFKLYEELININQIKITNLLGIDTAIIKYELKNYEEIIVNTNKGFNMDKIVEYIEQGIILPLMVHVNKFLSMIAIVEVEEYLKLYELVYYFLKLKEYVILNATKLFSEEKSEFTVERIFKNNYNCKAKGTKLLKKEYTPEQLRELQNDLEEMNYQNFEILNYGLVYKLFETHLENFVNKTSQKSLGKIFRGQDHYFSEEKIEKMKQNLTEASMFKTENEGIMFDVIIKYHNEKYTIDQSYFLQCLDEENSHYSLKYRNLLVRGLLFLISDPKSALRYSKNSLWALFRLLQYDTTNIQKCVYELYEQNSDLLDFNEMVNICFTNCVSALFFACNPNTATLNMEYYNTLLIVKICKFLCEEHNPKFQKIFFQEIKFKYLPDCYEANKNEIAKTKYSLMASALNETENGILPSKTRGSIMIKKTVKDQNQMSRILEENNEDNNDKEENNDEVMSKTTKSRQFGEVTVFDLMLKILGKIIFLANWERIEVDEDEKSVEFFYDMFNVINEFVIEMIQGTEKDNLESIVESSVDGEDEGKHFTEYLNSIKTILLRDDHNSVVLLKVRKDIMDFLMAFLEEKSTPTKLVTIMSNIIHPNNIIEPIINVMKKLYIQENGIEDKDYTEIEFNDEVCNYFSDVYFKNIEFCQCEEFELSNRMYQYLKLLATTERFSHEDAINLVESASKYPFDLMVKSYQTKKRKNDEEVDETDNVNNFLSNNNEMVFEDSFYETYFCVKFFEGITRTVLVQLEESEDPEDENKPVRVIFTLNPLVANLSEHTRHDFVERVNRDGRYIKLFSLMEQSELFYDEIKYNSEKSNPFIKWLNSLNYYYVSLFAFILALIINFYMIITLKKADIYEGSATATPVLNGLTYLDIGFNTLVVICWFYSKFPLYFEIEKKKYLQMIGKEELPLLRYIPVSMRAVVSRSEMFVSVWNLIFGTIGVCNPRYNFLYAVQLFGIVNLSVTLQNIIRAVTMKYRQLLNTIMLMFIVCYIFASIAFFYFSEDFIFNIFNPDDPTHPHHAENYCGTLIYCFIVHVDIGMRWDGGIGEVLNKRASFTYDPGYYIGRFFYEDLSFIFVNFVILSIIFGIIIDAFAELRDKSLRDENDKLNVCFICEATREGLEKKCINFNEHVTNEHNIWTYVDYMIGLKFVDIQDCNAVNSYVYEQVEKKQIAWFPVEKDEGEEEHDGDDGSEGSKHS